LLVVLPVSWNLRHEPDTAVWILGWTLAAPLLLALPIGKGFSRPDFWSSNLSVPSFLATRPLSSGEWVVIKLKVAAVSTVISWALVLTFLMVWLPLWANLEALNTIRVGLWMVQGHSVYPQYLLAALGIVAAAALTWKLLVGGLWIGLSGSGRLFVGSAVLYFGMWLAGLIVLTVVMNRDDEIQRRTPYDPDTLVAVLQWVAATAVIAKFALTAISWRKIGARRARQYLGLWLSVTLCLVIGAMMLWADGSLTALLSAGLGLPPIDSLRLGSLLILGAILLIPFARIGLAPGALAGNRHGQVNDQ
jgi:hypothetical protein